MMSAPESLDRFTAILCGVAAAAARARDADFAERALRLAAEGLPVLREKLALSRPDAAAALDRAAAKAREAWLAWPGSPRLRDATALLAGVRRFEAFAASVPAETLPDAKTLATAADDPAALAAILLGAAAARDPDGFGRRNGAAMARSVLLDAATFGLRQMMEPMALAHDFADAFAAAIGVSRDGPAFEDPAGAPAQPVGRSTLDAIMASLACGDRGQAADAAGVAYAAVVEAARPIAAAVSDPTRSAVELDRAVGLLIEARAIADGKAGDGAHREIAALCAAGDFATAGVRFDAALERRGREAGFSEASARLLEAGMIAAMLRRDAAAVARLEVERAARDGGGAALFGSLRASFIGWWSRGGRSGLPFDLEVAAELAALWAAAAADRAERGRALHNRAMALADRAAALNDQQARAEAVEAFRSALACRPRAEGAANWAMTLHGLGKALAAHGEHGGGVAALREAVGLFREALTVRTQVHAPVEWAATQLALAAALHALGDIEGGAGRYREAVEAYRAALSETCRTRAPLVWAKAQHDLGDALTALGQRGDGLGRMREATEAYGAGLAVLDRDCNPFDWAMTSGACGVAEGLLASATADAAAAASAIERIRAARDAMRAAGDLAYAAHFDSQLVAARGLHTQLRGV